MITIKRDRGWENPQTWTDVETLPGYVRDINPNEVKLDAVIGKYREPELRVCGLSNCHRKHYRGYIVSIKDGRVTNIGVDCGKNHFGVDFETMSRKLDRDWDSQQRREIISNAHSKLNEWIDRCSKLINGDKGASWLNREYRGLINRESGLPDYISKTILDLMRTGSNVLYKERESTDKEKEIARETGRKISQIIQDEVGVISGVAGVGKLDELRELLPKDLEPNLMHLSSVDVNTATEQELRHWVKWCGEVDNKLSRAAEIICEANKFFTKENIALLAELSRNKSEEKKIMMISRKYS